MRQETHKGKKFFSFDGSNGKVSTETNLRWPLVLTRTESSFPMRV